MKNLLKISFIFALVFIGLTQTKAHAQSGVKIQLQKFDLVLKDVNALYIKPIGAPFRDTTGAIQQKVYYELVRENGKLAERGNWDLPGFIYAHVNDYVLGTVTSTTIQTINQFFQAAELPELIATMPEQEE